MKKLLAFLALVIVFVGAAFGVLVVMTPPPPKMEVLPPPPETKAVAAALIDGNTGEMLANKNGELKIYDEDSDLHHRLGRRKGKARPECRCHASCHGPGWNEYRRPSGYADQPASAALRHDAYFRK